jgi:hypothetical protein
MVKLKSTKLLLHKQRGKIREKTTFHQQSERTPLENPKQNACSNLKNITPEEKWQSRCRPQIAQPTQKAARTAVEEEGQRCPQRPFIFYPSFILMLLSENVT